MVLTAFELFGNGGVGSFFFSNISDSFNYDLVDELSNDLSQLVTSSSGREVFTINLQTTLKITTPLDDKPFYASPEPRYKFGSYSILGLADITIDAEGGITSDYYLYETNFINYPLQRLEDFRMQIKFPNPSILDYGVVMADAINSPGEAEIIDPRKFQPGFMRPKNGLGLQINLNPGYNADMKITYTCTQISYGFSDAPNLIVVIG